MYKEKIRILVAVKGKKDRELIANFLKKKDNCILETSNDSKEAIKIIETSQERYNAVVIDDCFDEESKDLKVIKQINKYYPAIDIIFISESWNKTHAEELKKGSLKVKCFSKPLNLEELLTTIELACAQINYERERRISNKLHELSLDINSAIELQEILDHTCKAAVDILNVDHSGLVLFSKDLTKGEVIAEYPFRMGIKGREIQVKGVPIEERLVYDKKIINIPDVNRNEYKSLKDVIPTLRDYGISSLLIVPVVLNEKVIASFSLDMIKNTRFFYEDEVEVCKKLASLVAVAIGKARYVEELSVLNQIGMTLSKSAALNIDEVLQLIYEQTGRLMDVNNFYIASYDLEHNMVNFEFVVENGKKQKPRKGDYKSRKAGMGLTEYMIRTKESVLIKEDAEKFLNFLQVEKRGKMAKSWVGAPLVAGDVVLGVIGVQNFNTKNVYDKRDRDVLLTIASQAAIAIKNARLLEERELRYNELNALYDTSLDITRQLELEPLLEAIVKRAADLLEAPGGVLMVPDSTGNELEIKFTHNLDSIRGEKWKLGQGLVGQVVRSGKPMIINDYHNWEGRNPLFDEERYKELIRSLVAVPLNWEGEVIGVLAISDVDKHRNFNNNDIKLLERFANQAAIAIQNATLFNNKVKELESLRHADIALLSTMGLSEMLETILNELSRFVECDVYEIRLWDEEHRELTLELTKGKHPGKIPERKKVSMGISGLAAYDKMPIVSNNVQRDESHRKILKEIKDPNEQAYLYWIGSEAAVPLIAKERLVGVLAALKQKKNGFEENDIRLMETFAGPAAIALHNARIVHLSRQHMSLIAHQLKGPLQGIKSDIDYQRRYINEKYGEEERLNRLNRRLNEHFSRINKELDNFAFLIREDLVVEKKYSIKVMHIHQIIEEAAVQFEEYAGDRGIKIKVDISIRDLPRLGYDREKMFTVFTNLIENAVKYSHRDQTVVISGEKVRNWVNIKVWNFGLGILPDDKDRLFNLYTQGRLKDDKRFVQGTGIGLWVAREIIKAHGGEIKVWSGLFNHPELISDIDDVVHRGFPTEFTIKLPI